MNNEIAILIVGTGDNQIIFEVGKSVFFTKKRRVIVEITDEFRPIGEDIKGTNWGKIYVGYDSKVTKEKRLLFEVPVDNCVVIYKAALEVVDE